MKILIIILMLSCILYANAYLVDIDIGAWLEISAHLRLSGASTDEVLAYGVVWPSVLGAGTFDFGGIIRVFLGMEALIPHKGFRSDTISPYILETEESLVVQLIEPALGIVVEWSNKSILSEKYIVAGMALATCYESAILTLRDGTTGDFISRDYVNSTSFSVGWFLKTGLNVRIFHLKKLDRGIWPAISLYSRLFIGTGEEILLTDDLNGSRFGIGLGFK